MKVWAFYSAPAPKLWDLDPPEDLDEDEMAEWVMDNLPVVKLHAWTWQEASE